MKWFLMAYKKYAQFSGRSRRKEYWMFFLFWFLFFYGGFILSTVTETPALMSLVGLFYLGSLIPMLAVAVRRIHDTGNSGWFILIPIYSFILLCTNGDVGENEYGPDPKNETYSDDNVLDSDLLNS